MTLKQAEEAWEKKRINVFDLTHIWPHGDYPLRTVGKLTLNENAKVGHLYPSLDRQWPSRRMPDGATHIPNPMQCLSLLPVIIRGNTQS